jgi:hypothetical protein
MKILSIFGTISLFHRAFHFAMCFGPINAFVFNNNNNNNNIYLTAVGLSHAGSGF